MSDNVLVSTEGLSVGYRIGKGPLANPVANGQTFGRDQHIVAHDAPPRLCWQS